MKIPNAYHPGGSYRGGSARGKWRTDGQYDCNYGSRAYNNSSRGRGKNVNPAGPDGKPMLCDACGSYRHMLASCPIYFCKQADIV
jgi:hypothetical protein